MHSLTELFDFFKSNEIEIEEFNGWRIKVGKDIWTLANDVFHLNGKPQNLKEKGFITNYKQVYNVRENRKTRSESILKHQGGQTRKWRGISSRNYR